MVTVSFPGFGIGHFSFNKVAFSIGPVEVRWYGLILVSGIILAFIYASYRAKQNGISFDDMLDFTIYGVIAGIVGARLYYVLTSLDHYSSIWEAFRIWEGGLAIYGAIIGGALALFITCRIKKIDWKLLFDCVAPGVMIAQALGRWGNFFNGEAFGATPKESSPLYFMRMGLQHESWGQEYFYQPTFLYESLWNLLGFILINIFYKKKKYNGQVVLWYATWYGFGRMFIEGLREDSLYVGSFRISQLVGCACFVLGTLTLIVIAVKRRRNAWWYDGDDTAETAAEAPVPADNGKTEPKAAEEAADEKKADDNPEEKESDEK